MKKPVMALALIAILAMIVALLITVFMGEKKGESSSPETPTDKTIAAEPARPDNTEQPLNLSLPPEAINPQDIEPMEEQPVFQDLFTGKKSEKTISLSGEPILEEENNESKLKGATLNVEVKTD